MVILMYVIEHALLNIGKNKSRNILLGAIIFTVITAAVIALAIFNTSSHIMDETMLALQCAVRVAPRLQTTNGPARAAADENPQIVTGDTRAASAERRETSVTMEQYLSFAESEYLSGADIKEETGSADGVNAVYYLLQPGMLSEFEAELRREGLPEDYVVRTDESAFERIIGPVESLNKLALTFLFIVLALGAIIMILLSAIAIRERKYEIGVLRAMGMKKKNVALSLWIEITAIAVICFMFGAGAGAVLSQPVSDSMMSWQAQSPTSQSSSLADRLSETDPVQPEKINIAVGGSTMLEIFGVAILLASIAGIISISSITKSEPIKILMERN